MGDELNTGAEQVLNDTPLDAETVQAAEQTVEGAPESSQGLPTAGVDRETEFRMLQGEYTRARQELSDYHKIGKTPEEIATAIRSFEQSQQQIVEALQKYAGGNQSPENELPPELRDNAILTDPDYGYVKQALEYIAEQRVKPLTEAQAQRERAETIRAAEAVCGEFVKANPELNLTAQQLYDTCIKGRHNPFTQLTQAAIDAAGGLDKFLLAKNKKFLADYQEEAKKNRSKSGTVVSPTAPVGTSPEPPKNWEDHREWIYERARANAAARQGLGGG